MITNKTVVEHELELMASDFFHFAKYTMPNGVKSFERYIFHDRLFNAYESRRYVIMPKFRQGGFTTFALLYALWKCMFNLNQDIIYVCKTDHEAVGVNRNFREIIKRLPPDFKPKLTKENDHDIFFDTGSSIHFHSTSAVRGHAATLLIIDEAAFIPNMEDKWKALLPTIMNNGKCIVQSTPNGVKNWFYKTWNLSVNYGNNFHSVYLNYLEHPRYQDEQFVKNLKEQLESKRFSSEIEAVFTHDS